MKETGLCGGKLLQTWARARESLRCNLVAFFPTLLPAVGVSPISANLRLTHRCSAHCLTCNHWSRAGSGELSTAQWKLIINGLIESGVLGVSFTGGDILLREDSVELLRFCAVSGLEVNATLNGYLITEDLAKQLMASSPSRIDLSLDDLGHDFDRLRGTMNAAGKVEEAIRLLRHYDNGSTGLGIAATIMKDTLGSIRDVVRFALTQGLPLHFNLIHFTHYFSDTPFSRYQYGLSREERKELCEMVNWLARLQRQFPHQLPKPRHLKWILSYFDDFRQRGTPCLKTMLRICVDPDGEVRPCCSLKPAGNLTRQSLKQIASSPTFLELVRKGLSKECPGCSCHYIMNLDASLVGRLKSRLAGIEKRPDRS